MTTFFGNILMNDLKIEITPGGYFQEIQGIIGYEKSLPLIYTQSYIRRYFEQMSETSDTGEECQSNMSWTACQFLETCSNITSRLQSVLNTDIKFQYIELLQMKGKKKENREKRGIQFFGDALNFCCDVITARQTSVLVENEQNLNNNYNNLKETILTTHAELLNVTHKLNAFSNNINNNFGTIFNDMKKIAKIIKEEQSSFSTLQALQKTIINILNLFQSHLSNNYNKEIMDHCKDGIGTTRDPPKIKGRFGKIRGKFINTKSRTSHTHKPNSSILYPQANKM